MVLVFILDEIYEGSAGKDTVRILHTRTVLCQSSHRHHLTRHNNRTHNMVSFRKVLYVPLFTNTISQLPTMFVSLTVNQFMFIVLGYPSMTHTTSFIM